MKNPSLRFFKNKGIAYIALLCVLALMGLALAQAIPDLAHQRQHEKEAELLWIGEHYKKAIESYYQASPGSVKVYPKELSELLYDRRFFGIKRHLRRLYRDPMTGNIDWGVIKDKDGGIMAIYSQSTQPIIKETNFPPSLKYLEGGKQYRDWKFGVLN
ncbi:MAG: type II secretion system protein [Pseudomonadota bacterium]